MTYEEKKAALQMLKDILGEDAIKEAEKGMRQVEQGAALSMADFGQEFKSYQNGERDTACGVSEWTGPEFDAEGPYYECKACEGGLRGKTPFCPWCGRRMKNHTYTLKDY